ncbi:hypothetical protein B6N60_00346 [Richelia sinica FACHB-800]|uniref:Uncharacterized protein n=1 Tax=Richelia sinica FACHB-800 TaxID=1357546 RepID=A0A975T423_9NOST|nr:hypothetical protein [Richelia sinica]MBD2667423.1 hypothetical protein [Richelia sinica FACHB-800]QXE21669.1 hypothetical protein B6N60_00346 [Richelia sinica FACHB-800]
MVAEKSSDRQQRLDSFLKAVEAAQQLQDDIMKYGLDAAYLYCDDVDGDWLETWGNDDDEPGYIEKITTFLESDDVVAVKVRNRLQDKSLDEIIAGLEYCLSQLKEEDRIFAAKDFLVGDIVVSGSSRASGNSDFDEVELLELAEDLIERLTEILG